MRPILEILHVFLRLAASLREPNWGGGKKDAARFCFRLQKRAALILKKSRYNQYVQLQQSLQPSRGSGGVRIQPSVSSFVREIV
jgi:hypothetical protein